MRINLPSLLACGLLGLFTLSGCASFKDYHYEHTQRLRAISQYRECGKNNCSKYPRDYKAGWKDGFYEVSTGGSDCPPAIAPAKYWKPGQILDDCDNRRHAYYSGWQDGAARAAQFPDTHYLKVWESCECPFPRCNDECSVESCGCPASLPIDDGLVESNLVAPPAAPPLTIQSGNSVPPSPAAPIKDEPAPADSIPEPQTAPAEKANTDEPAEELPAPKPDENANSDAKADYNFTRDGGVVIDFTSEKQPSSPSDFSRSPVVTGTVAELDFTFGDEDISDQGMIEFDED